MGSTPFEDLVEVGRYPSEVQASIIRNRLDSAGISTFLADAELIGLEWPIQQAIGGVKIFTPQHQAGFAKQLIADWREAAKSTERIPEDPSQRILRVAFVSLIMVPLSIYSLPLSLIHLNKWGRLNAEARRKTIKAIALSCCAFFILVVLLFAIVK